MALSEALIKWLTMIGSISLSSVCLYGIVREMVPEKSKQENRCRWERLVWACGQSCQCQSAQWKSTGEIRCLPYKHKDILDTVWHDLEELWFTEGNYVFVYWTQWAKEMIYSKRDDLQQEDCDQKTSSTSRLKVETQTEGMDKKALDKHFLLDSCSCCVNASQNYVNCYF